MQVTYEAAPLPVLRHRWTQQRRRQRRHTVRRHTEASIHLSETKMTQTKKVRYIYYIIIF